jgi:regulator of replication initiation timing
MAKEELPSINPKLDAMCEMLKTIHDLNERNKMLEAQIEEMKSDYEELLDENIELEDRLSESRECY